MAETVFSLQSSDSPTNWLHARALCSGGAHAVAATHRGLDLSAGADITAGASASVAGTVKAALGAGADVELALAAAFPLNLFSQAGIIADVEAAAALTGSFSLEVDLPVGTLIERVVADVGAGAWADLAQIVCQQLEVSAGYWATVSISVQARAQALLVGSFLNQPDGSTPGFTFHCEYGYGYGLGMGSRLITNVGFADTAKLFNQLSGRASTILEQQLEALVGRLTGQAANDARAALPFAQMVVPLAVRSAFELGAVLAAGGDPKSAEQSVARSAVSQLQSWLMARFVDLAVSNFGSVLTRAENAISQLPVSALSDVVMALRGLKDGFSTLDGADSPAVVEWLWAILDLCESLWMLSQTPLIDQADVGPWQDDIALFWSAGSLANAIGGFIDSDGQAFDPAALAQVSAPGDPIAAHVAAAINKPAGSGLTFADLISFLVSNDRTSELEQAIPEIAPVIDAIRTALSSVSGSPLLQALLVDLANPQGTTPGQLLGALGPVFEQLIDQQVVPKLLGPLAASGDSDVVSLLTGTVQPTLEALVGVVIPALQQFDQGTLTAETLAEQLSAVLLQFLGRFVISAINVLADEAAAQGAAYASQLAGEIRASNSLDAVGDVEAALISSAPWLFYYLPTVDDIANILDQLIAPTLTEFDSKVRQPAVDLMNELLTVGLSGGQLSTVNALATSPQAPSDSHKLEQLAEHLLTTSLTLLVDTAGRAAEIILEHFEELGKRIIKDIEKAASAALAAAEHVVNNLAGDINALGQEISRLAQQVGAAVANIAQEIADLDGYLQSLESTIIQSIKDDGWSFFDSVLQDLGLAGTPIESVAKGLYDDAFGAIQWLLEAPLVVLKDLAEFIHDELMPAAVNGQANPQALSQAVASRIGAQSASDVSIPIKADLFVTKVDLGTWTLPAPQVRGSISNGVLGDSNVNGHLQSLSDRGNAIGSMLAQQNAAAVLRDQELNQQQAAQQFGGLATGFAPSARIDAPGDNSVFTGTAPLRIVLPGVNGNYVRQVLGVPPRVKIIINAIEYDYAPDDWKETPDGLLFEGTLAPSTVKLVPRGTTLAGATVPLSLAGGVRLVPQIGRNGLETFRAKVQKRRRAGGTGSHGSGSGGAGGSGGLIEEIRLPSGMLIRVIHPAYDRSGTGSAGRAASSGAPASAQAIAAPAVTSPPAVSESGQTAAPPRFTALPGSLRFPNAGEIGAGVVWGVLGGENLVVEPVVPTQPGLNVVQVVVDDGQGRQAQALARVLIGRAGT